MANGGKVPVRMTPAKRKRLEDAGWAVGSAAAFLRLSREEQVIIEMRLALSAVLRDRRRVLDLSQVALAKRLGSSQSRVAKMEAADPSVSLDLLVRALLATGVTRRMLGCAIAACCDPGGAPMSGMGHTGTIQMTTGEILALTRDPTAVAPPRRRHAGTRARPRSRNTPVPRRPR